MSCQKEKLCRICDTEPAVDGKDFCADCDTPEARAQANEHFDQLRVELLDSKQLHSLRQKCAAELATRDDPRPEYREAVFAAAVDKFEDEGEIEIDHTAILSPSDDGCYVEMWGHVKEVSCQVCGQEFDLGDSDGRQMLCPDCLEGQEEEKLLDS
jgi:hypothetical protein